MACVAVAATLWAGQSGAETEPEQITSVAHVAVSSAAHRDVVTSAEATIEGTAALALPVIPYLAAPLREKLPDDPSQDRAPPIL